MHNIFSIGQLLTELDFKILNVITWPKTNPPPNFSCRYFTHSTEQINRKLMFNKIKIIQIFIFVFFITNTFSQKKLDPWNKLVKRNNFIVSFIFYSKADNSNNGIVIKIENENKFTIKYRFTIIVRTETVEKEKIFNGESIAEVGIKKWKFYKSKFK